MEQSTRGILYVAPFFRPSHGGAETYVDELCEFQRKRGTQVYVLAYQPLYERDPLGPSVERKENLYIRRYRWIGFDLFHKLEKHPILRFAYLTTWLMIRAWVWMLFNHKKIDVIDAQGLSASFTARLLGKCFGKPVVTTILALYNFVPGSLFSRVTAKVLADSGRILVEKGKSANELASIGCDPEKFVEFNQWADHERFKPADKEAVKQELGLEGRFVVLFVGRAIPEKGADLLLEAAQKADQGITFLFVTNLNGDIAERIVATSKDLPNVRYAGAVDYGELHRYYQAADIFCIPSKYEEGVARVVSEAVSCGTPVVSSNRGSLPAVLDEQVARLVEPEAGALLAAIEALYHDRETLERLTENCTWYREEHFGEANLHLIEGAYEQLTRL